MTRRNQTRANQLRGLWLGGQHGPDAGTDYKLIASAGCAHVARSRTGQAALVIELSHMPSAAVGRRAAGCELVPHQRLSFEHEGREWHAAAAALVCIDAELLDAFVVLAADLEHRIGHAEPTTWQALVGIVEEWQSLMAPRGRPSTESEVGIWGELWFLLASADVDRLVAGWRGPDRAATDFLLDGQAAEVKTSRQQRQHHVSQAQVSSPMGSDSAWLLSLWVGVDPIRGQTVPELVERLLSRAAEPGAALRRLASAGYAHADRVLYEARLALLADPEWFRITDVPRVRTADPGVSRLRYLVTLDQTRAATSNAPMLWQHFLGCQYGAPHE